MFEPSLIAGFLITLITGNMFWLWCGFLLFMGEVFFTEVLREGRSRVMSKCPICNSKKWGYATLTEKSRPSDAPKILRKCGLCGHTEVWKHET